MSEEQETWLRRLKDARRVAMAHYLADRHEEGDKMERFAEELEQFGLSRGWAIPEEDHVRKPDR